MALLRNFESAVAANITLAAGPPAVTLNRWTGKGRNSLGFAGKLYSGGLVASSESSLEMEEPRQFSSFDISLTLAADRQLVFNEDRGPSPVEILWLWRADAEDDWKQAVSVSGRISEMNYIYGRLTVQVQQVIYDVDKGETILMDNATQQRRFPGDLGFGYSAQIAARGGIQQRFPWPP